MPETSELIATYANPAATRMLGRSVDEIVGRPLRLLLIDGTPFADKLQRDAFNARCARSDTSSFQAWRKCAMAKISSVLREVCALHADALSLTLSLHDDEPCFVWGSKAQLEMILNGLLPLMPAGAETSLRISLGHHAHEVRVQLRSRTAGGDLMRLLLDPTEPQRLTDTRAVRLFASGQVLRALGGLLLSKDGALRAIVSTMLPERRVEYVMSRRAPAASTEGWPELIVPFDRAQLASAIADAEREALRA